jgi:hypothetical protein
MGRFGVVEQAKEKRWEERRKAARRRFMAIADTLSVLDEARRADFLAVYERESGPFQAETMRQYVAAKVAAKAQA